MKNLIALAILLASVPSFAQHTFKQTRVFPGLGIDNLTPNSYGVYFTSLDLQKSHSLYLADSAGNFQHIDSINKAKTTYAPYGVNDTFVYLNNKIYYLSNTTQYGQELTINDGSSIKTVDINPGSSSSGIKKLFVHNNNLYFIAYDSLQSRGVFKYEPVSEKLTKIFSIGFDNYLQDIYEIIFFKDRLIMSAIIKQPSGQRYRVLYTHDFQLNIGWPLVDANNGIYQANPEYLTLLNGNLYFVSRENNINSVYKYDGISTPKIATEIMSAGVKPYKDNNSWNAKTIIAHNNKLYINTKLSSGYWGLYEHDPISKSGSYIQFDNLAPIYILYNITPYKGNLLFSTHEQAKGVNLWMYEPGKQTQKLTDFTTNSSITNVRVVNDNIFFVKYGWSNETTLYLLSPENTASISYTNYAANTNVYPNPVKDVAHIQFSLKQSQTLNITLTDMNGRVVYQTGNVLYSASKHTVDVPTGQLTKGNYLYTINNKNGFIQSGKLVKQ